MLLTETTALLVAGRVLDSFFCTVAMVDTLRRLVEREPGLAVVLGSDETYAGAPSEPEEDVYAPVAIGVIVAMVSADDRPAGPIRAVDVDEALRRVRAVPQLWWRRVANELGSSSLATAAARRAAIAEDARVRRLYQGVAYDGPDLLCVEDYVHLVAAGPLAQAELARGELSELPLDEHGLVDEEDGDGWLYGQMSGQKTPRFGVRGERIAFANELTFALDRDTFSQPGSLYLFARYD